MNETYLEQTQCFATKVDISWLLIQIFVAVVVADNKEVIRKYFMLIFKKVQWSWDQFKNT